MQNMFFYPRKIIFHTLYSNRFETVYCSKLTKNDLFP